jgi:hypothetical protein
MPKYTYNLDIMTVKAKLDSGRFATKMNSFGSILLEDTQTCEAIKLMQLPEGYSFHEKGKWVPVWEYTSRSIDHPMEGHDAWSCSECGWVTDERHDWCICGADMRESNKMTVMTKEKLEALLKQL